MKLTLQQALALFNLSLPLDVLDLKRQYRRLAKKHHPDTVNASPQAFLLVQQAYQLLLAHSQATKQAATKAAPLRSEAVASYQAVNTAPPTSPLPDTHVTLTLSPQQAQKGGRHTFTFTWQAPCHRCHNHPVKKQQCKQCHQQGQKPQSQKVTLQLPSPVTDGSQLRLSQQGIAYKGQSSALVLTFKVAAPPAPEKPAAPQAKAPVAYTKTLTLSIWQVLAGGDTFTISTPQGSVSWQIPAGGIHPDKRVNFAKMGFNHTDWYITLNITWPDKPLSESCQRLLKQCAHTV